jgi:hypothetical protein
MKLSGIGFALIMVLGIKGSVMGNTAAAATTTEQLRYRVQHSVFGNIGTYTNVVQIVGDMTRVRTSAHFLVTMLGVGLHREDAERTERWQGSRLKSFLGVTKKMITPRRLKVRRGATNS